jgi:hypothetical protein
VSIAPIAACFCLLVSAAFAQNNFGTISGLVSDPEEAAVARAPVQARNVATGALYRGLSSASGEYTLTRVPAGTYEISVNMPCCAY